MIRGGLGFQIAFGCFKPQCLLTKQTVAMNLDLAWCGILFASSGFHVFTREDGFQ